MSDIKKIKVGGVLVGINGLVQAIEEMTEEFAQKSDQEVAAEMMARLGPRNYFAPSARDEYEAALVREFRKALGQPFEADAGGGLEIRVVGPGCPRCEQLFERVAKVLTELGVGADLDKVTDAKEIAATGVLVTPGLIVNGKVVATGKVPKESEIRKWLR